MTVRDGLSLHMPYELFAGPESEDLVSLVLFLAEFTLRTLLIYVLGTTLLFLSGCSNLGARRVLHPPGTHPYHYHYHRLTRPPSPNDSPLPDAAGPWDRAARPDGDHRGTVRAVHGGARAAGGPVVGGLPRISRAPAASAEPRW